MSLCILYCLTLSVARLEGELNDVEALKDVRVELVTQKEVGLCTYRADVSGGR